MSNQKLERVRQLAVADLDDEMVDREFSASIEALSPTEVKELLSENGFDLAEVEANKQEISGILQAASTPGQVRQAFEQLKKNRKACTQ